MADRIAILILCFFYLSMSPSIVVFSQFSIKRPNVGSCPLSGPGSINSTLSTAVSLALVPSDATNQGPDVTIVRTYPVCIAAGLSRDTINSVSLLVEYICLDDICNLFSIAQNVKLTGKFQFECREDGSFFSLQASAPRHSANTVANFSTVTATRCEICGDMPFFGSNPVTFCLGRLS